MKKKASTRLTMAQYLQLSDWYKSQHAGFVSARRCVTEVAELAQKDTKLPVSHCHIEKLSKALNMTLDSKHAKTGKTKTFERIERLEMLVNYLFTKLGEEVPATLTN